MKNKFFANFLLCFCSIIFIIFFLELMIRLLGYGPWETIKTDLFEPITYEYNEELGWKPKEGVYIFPPWSSNGKYTKLTVLENGNRFSGEPSSPSIGEVLLIGGSATQGWAVDDKETFSWFLQKKLNNLKVNNYGVGAYGTYQSLLLLESIMKNRNDIKYVIYGFIKHHEVRNIAHGSWLHLLTKYSRRGHLALPYASLNKDNKLVKNPPVQYISLPFREQSALIAKVEKKIMKMKSISRDNNKTRIAQEILLEMKKVSELNKSKFVFVFLHSNPKILNSYSNYLKKNNILFINCSYPETSEYQVEKEGHPNAKLHQLWANCIYDQIFK